MSAGDTPAAPRQAVLVGPRHFELRPTVAPHPGPGEILLQIKCALSCGTDLKFYRRGHPLFSFPMPFGHEFSGVVAEVGTGVEGFRPGDELMAAPTAPCGNCFFCGRGQESLCISVIDTMVMGAYADFLLLPAHVVARNVFKKPAGLPFEEAALLEPLACVVHAQAIACPQRFETCMVLGAGAFGLLHVILLKAAGAGSVVVAGRGDSRLRWAAEMGADQVIDARSEDVAAKAAALNGGYGPDLVIEATGQVSGWESALRCVRRGGRVVFFGGCAAGTSVQLDTRRMHYDSLTLIAPFHFRPEDVRGARDLLAERKLGVGRIINERKRLSELPQVFDLLERGDVLKCAIIP
ncbi:MAG TPA: zinc-binding dehydrogenase [Candidatus Binataceae bacterium]|nr:zinc-binding dehydrogenase [Candidatus Binataceae bacterium]